MERKIGEVFECNGTWYQCIEGSYCKRCDFHRTTLSTSQCDKKSYCLASKRKDKTAVVFRRLEKVGEPYPNADKLYQLYRLPMNIEKLPHTEGINLVRLDIVEIEIKQKQEDMEEKKIKLRQEDVDYIRRKFKEITQDYIIQGCDKEKVQYEFGKIFEPIQDLDNENLCKNLKPFSLEAAKQGKPVCTRDGRKARIICFDRVTNSTNEYTGHLIVLVTNPNGDEQSWYYTNNGVLAGRDEYDNQKWDLMMLPEKKEGWVNVYKGDNGISKYNSDDIVFNTKKEATQYAQYDDNYITTVKISWEE